MIPRPKPERFRLRRTMMFMNAQKPSLIKHAYIYGCDSIMLDLEDAVAENQKDAARFSLYHALKTIDYGETEVIVRINGLDTPHWQEDIRVCVAGGADGIRIAKCESAQDVLTVEKAVEAAEEEFGVEKGRTLLMPVLESCLAEGMGRSEAGVTALLHLIAPGGDTNMIKRGGAALAGEMCSLVREELRKNSRPARERVLRLDELFIRHGLSPGGCADLLAVSYFIHDWKANEL